MAASVVSLCLLASFAVAGSLAFPRMLRGRPFGGMLGEPPVDKSVKLPEAQWFAQRLNHFDDSNTRTWQQRFFVNDSFFHKKDGPVFLMIGGEGAASPRWMVTGSWIQYAQDFGALAFMLEHRFYGESHPTRSAAQGLQMWWSGWVWVGKGMGGATEHRFYGESHPTRSAAQGYRCDGVVGFGLGREWGVLRSTGSRERVTPPGLLHGGYRCDGAVGLGRGCYGAQVLRRESLHQVCYGCDEWQGEGVVLLYGAS